jgi:ribosomal protein L11 methyltransferase
VLAGILQRQADELIEAYAPWRTLRTVYDEYGWILSSAHRPA